MNVFAILAVVVLLAFIAYATARIGPRFMVRRLAGLVFVLLGVSFIIFILGFFAPGDAVFTQLGQHYTPQAAAALRHAYGLDLPWYTQYLNYLNRLIHFDLGTSFTNDTRTVWQILQLYVPASVQLGISGTVLALIVGVPLGILAAVRANSRVDASLQAVGLVFYALPSFVIIPLFFVAMVSLHQRGIPTLATSGWGTIDSEIAPIAIFGLGIFAYYLRLTRASMLEVLGQDYVRTARAKGVRERVVVWRHAFRNAVIPLLTAVGPALAFAVVGVFIVEDFFNIPGIGEETINAISQRDFPIVQGVTILLASAVVFMNLVTDVAYGLADPRIKTQ
ncbi:MAG TPA: ABC transporter permease [Ktedonobacterales bacterium]|nr:ABC transporter permease [Ktedonobacterales bacterium]